MQHITPLDIKKARAKFRAQHTRDLEVDPEKVQRIWDRVIIKYNKRKKK